MYAFRYWSSFTAVNEQALPQSYHIIHQKQYLDYRFRKNVCPKPYGTFSGHHKKDTKKQEMAYFHHFLNSVKAGTGNRTRDLRTTNATLYRLSHASKSIFVSRDYVSLSNTISFVNQNKEKKKPKLIWKIKFHFGVEFNSSKVWSCQKWN